jgi:Family of unknown function (DUF5691)
VTGWDDLVSTALLGTDRRPPSLDGLPEQVRARLAAEYDDPARLVLDAAALAATYRRAGRMPLRGLEPLPAADSDPRPAPSEAAVRRLAAMSDGSYPELLPEWLAAVRDRGLRVPPEFLPELAELARARPDLRAVLAAVTGSRAAWLAALDRNWRFLTDAGPEVGDGSWRHGTREQRVRWLTRSRANDPAAAREALATSWPKEPPAAKAELLAVLADGLSGADEELCEAALDDPATRVRRTAARLLAVLPGSAYRQRMADRVRACLTVRPGVLAVELPASCDETMLRDGIEPRPQAGTGIGPRAWWFVQLVARAPVEVYGPPDDLLGLDVQGCDPELLHAGLAAATVREGDPAFARALLRAAPDAGGRTSELVGVLPAAEWPAAVSALHGSVELADAVEELPAPWPAGLATAMLGMLLQAEPDESWFRFADTVARSVPPDLLDHPLVRDAISRHDESDWEETWQRRLAETLLFRREMYEELR